MAQADGLHLGELPEPLHFTILPSHRFRHRHSMATSDQILDKLIILLKDFTQDWDSEYEGAYGRDTTLLGELGFESIDIIQFIVAIEEDLGISKTPFDKLLMNDGRYVDDLSIGQIADFLAVTVPSLSL
jgi:acyl carrier protein